MENLELPFLKEIRIGISPIHNRRARTHTHTPLNAKTRSLLARRHFWFLTFRAPCTQYKARTVRPGSWVGITVAVNAVTTAKISYL